MDIVIFSPIFWAGFLYTAVASVFAFLLPGMVITAPLPIPKRLVLPLALVIGMAAWAWQGFIFGYLHVRWMSYIYLVGLLVIWIKLRGWKRFQETLKSIQLDRLVVLLLIVGIAHQSIGVWFMGARFNDGIHMCCGHAPDNNLQLAITNELIHRFPPYEPGMYGVPLQNYHYWGHMVIAELVRVFYLPLIVAEYQFFPLLLSFALGISAVSFASFAGLSPVFSRWVLFFLFFGSDFGYLLLFFLGKGWNFSLGGMEDGSSFLFNYPRAFAIIFLFSGVTLLDTWMKKFSWYGTVLLALLFGSIVGYKVYTGIFILSGLAALGCLFLIKHDFRRVVMVALTVLVAMGVYIPVNKAAGGLFFTGLWRLHDFIVLPQLGLSHLELARQIYVAHHNWPRLIEYESISFFLFVFVIFGSKIIGLLQIPSSVKRIPGWMHSLFLAGIASNFILGMFFWQVSGGPNTFNFIVNIYIVLSIYAALSCAYVIGELPAKFKYMSIAMVIGLTIPKSIYSTVVNIDHNQHAYGLANVAQLQALEYINNHTPAQSLVLSHDIGSDYDSPYVSYLADRPAYFSGIIGELRGHGVSYQSREAIVSRLFLTSDSGEAQKLLHKAGIRYIFMPVNERLNSSDTSTFLVSRFVNSEYQVLEVKE